MRLFLASFATLDDYASIRSDCNMIHGKWVEPCNLHLTYKFLGDTFTPQEVIEKLSSLSHTAQAVPVKSLGVFKNRILYAKVEATTLRSLQRTIVKKLQLKQEPFTPHVTLARIKKIEDNKRFKECLSSYRNKKLGMLHTRLLLLSSELTSNGPIYSILKEF